MVKSRSVEKERAQRIRHTQNGSKIARGRCITELNLLKLEFISGDMYLSRVFQRLRRWTLADGMSEVQVVNMTHWDCVGK